MASGPPTPLPPGLHEDLSEYAKSPLSSGSLPSTPVELPAQDVAKKLTTLNLSTTAQGDEKLSTRLRRATAQAHERVIQPPVVSQLVSGQLDKFFHSRYLMMLLLVYTSLEQALARHPSHEHLSQVYDPAVLSRIDGLERDLTWYAGAGWRQSAEFVSLSDGSEKSLVTYRERLSDLAEADPTLLLAHAYVRYLGDLSGGQQIARTLRKRYELPADEGTSYYIFSRRDAEGRLSPATPNELKALKDWFRHGLDEAGERMNEQDRNRVIAEAQRAYEYNIRMLSSFEDIVDARQSQRTSDVAHEGISFNWRLHVIMVAISALLGLWASGLVGAPTTKGKERSSLDSSNFIKQ